MPSVLEIQNLNRNLILGFGFGSKISDSVSIGSVSVIKPHERKKEELYMKASSISIALNNHITQKDYW